MVPREMEKFSRIMLLNCKLYRLLGTFYGPDIPSVDPYGIYMNPYGHPIDPYDLFKIK
jgi:hypothetical protein